VRFFVHQIVDERSPSNLQKQSWNFGVERILHSNIEDRSSPLNFHQVVRIYFSTRFVAKELGIQKRMATQDVYPRPEYPRPDFQRGTIEGKDWLNLNGPWQFRFDGDKRGLENGWHLPDGPDWREQIIVPFCWESLAAWGEAETAGNENYYSTRVFRNPLEVNRANHSYVDRYEVGWYRRRIQIPGTEFWRGKRIILTPFEFDLTDTLRRAADGSAEALVTLRVEDPMDNREQPVGKQWHWYTPTSGIWQTVYLEPRESSFLETFRVYPDIDKKNARFEIECANTPDDFHLQIYLIPPAGEVEVIKTQIKNNFASVTFEISHPYIWNPNQPHLYKLAFKLKQNGRTIDYVQSYFGMRKIDSGKSDDDKGPAILRLNNVPRYLRGALYQSYHPDGVYTAGNVETLKQDILWAKHFGFNFLRIHIKIDDPLLLYYADSIGIMLMADFPNFGEGGNTPLGRRRFEEMMRAAIRRDFNHPSIIAWCVFNETWGFGGQAEFVKLFPDLKKKIFKFKTPVAPGAVSAADPAIANQTNLDAEKAIAQTPEKKREANLAAHAWVQSTWEMAKKLDPTRLVEDMSVVHWEHLEFYAHGDTDINSWHFYIDDYFRAKEHIQKVVDASYAGSTFNFVPGYADKGQPLINSEYGGIGALDGNRDCSWSFKFLTNELRRHGQISAYIYTELHDVEWEYNGFLSYDRTLKEFGYDPRIVNESDALPINFPPITKQAPGSTLKIEVASSHFSTVARDKISLSWRLGGMDGWGRIHQDVAKGLIPISFPHRRVELAHTLELKMPDKPMLCTLLVEALDTSGKTVASNFVQIFVADDSWPPREESERSLLLRGTPETFSLSEWSGGMSSREQIVADKFCYGNGNGFFEWNLPLENADLKKARRLRFLCEASSHRTDTPQTTKDRYPTTLHVDLNGIPICKQIVVDHPHDSRGALSYLSGGKNGRGAYGYLISVAIDGELLRHVAEAVLDNNLKVRCTVPAGELAAGGLTIYGTDSGRYPISMLVIVEW
jgi:hypothetical protein